ncbi:MAG: c-type cytochrome [Gemmatimonadales bacterium]
MIRGWALVATLLAACKGRPDQPPADIDPGPVPAALAEGERTYQTRCRECHGPHGVGTTHGPPLVHPYYEPSHHADEAFRLAIRSGVRPHHWHFGPMPPISGMDDRAISAVIGYIRWLQQQRGIV